MHKKGKVVDLEVKEGAEDIDIEGVDPILKLLEYIPPAPRQGEHPKGPR